MSYFSDKTLDPSKRSSSQVNVKLKNRTGTETDVIRPKQFAFRFTTDLVQKIRFY